MSTCTSTVRLIHKVSEGSLRLAQRTSNFHVHAGSAAKPHDNFVVGGSIPFRTNSQASRSHCGGSPNLQRTSVGISVLQPLRKRILVELQLRNPGIRDFGENDILEITMLCRSRLSGRCDLLVFE